MTAEDGGRDPLPWLAALVLLAAYSLGVIGHDLWTPDEPRVASVARQVAEGAWVVPTLNGAPFLEQPPLYYWCVAGVYRAFGYDPPEIGRIVSAAFGMGGLAWTYLMAFHLARSRGRKAARRVGVLAALSLGFSLEYFSTAHRVVVDGALTFFTTGAAYAYLRGASRERSGLGWHVLGHSMASLAFLAKGVIGLAAPGLALIAIALAHREPRRLLRAHLWLAPLCFLAITGPWFWLLWRQTGVEGFREIFVTNTLGRAVQIGTFEKAHRRPFYFYVIYLPIHLLPAALFTVGAALRRHRCHRGGAGVDAVERFAYDVSFLWLGSGFLLLSAAATKRPIYLIPFFPAAAIAGGFWLDAFLDGRAEGRYERIAPVVLAALLILTAIALPAVALYLGANGLPWAAAGCAAGAAAGVGSWRAVRRGRRQASFLLWAGGLAAVLAAAVPGIVPAIDAFKSLRSVSVRVAELVPRDHPICAMSADETTEGMIPFYGERPVKVLAGREELDALRARDGDVFLLTVDKRRVSRDSEGWAASQYGSVEDLPHEVIFEDLGSEIGSRVFRLVRILRSN